MPCPKRCARGSPKKVRHSSGPTDCSTGVRGSSTDSTASPHAEATACGGTPTPPPTVVEGPGDRFRRVQHSTEPAAQPPVAHTPPRHHRAPRTDPRRRLRMAARQGHAGGDGPPRGGERVHAGTDRAPRRPAAVDLRRDQVPHPRDRPLGADPQPRPLVLRPVLRGEGVRRQLPGPGDRPRRLDAAAARRGLRARPARPPGRGAAARPRRTGRRPRVLLAGRLQHQPRQHPPRLLDRRCRRRALHDPGPRPGHPRAPTRRDRRRHRGRHLGPFGRAALLHDRRRVLALRQDLAAHARHLPGRRRARPPRGGRPVLRGGGPQPQRPVRHRRGRVQDHLGVPLPRLPATPMPASSCSARAGRVWSTPSTTRPSAARTSSSCCTTTPARTSRSAPRPSRPPPPRTGRRWSPTTRPSGSRTSTRSPAISSCTSAARG